LKYSIRQRSDGKWTWKYDKVMRTPGARAPGWNADQLWECVGKIDCPTLVLRGDRSDIFAEETMQKMGRVIPDCTTTTISNAGHLVQGDNPAEFLVEVGKFLGRVH
jgi:pimeloyl-ACP methyl ester carboxylesterase